MFTNTQPETRLSIRATINEQLERVAYFSGYYDGPIEVANYRALSGPYLSTVIEQHGNTYRLRAQVKSSLAYGTLGDLMQLLHGLDDYPLINDETHSDLTHEELLRYLTQTYPELSAEELASYIYEHCDESPYLESGMSLYIPDEDETVAQYLAEKALTN